jgi:hypothetical protein
MYTMAGTYTTHSRTHTTTTTTMAHTHTFHDKKEEEERQQQHHYGAHTRSTTRTSRTTRHDDGARNTRMCLVFLSTGTRCTMLFFSLSWSKHTVYQKTLDRVDIHHTFSHDHLYRDPKRADTPNNVADILADTLSLALASTLDISIHNSHT